MKFEQLLLACPMVVTACMVHAAGGAGSPGRYGAALPSSAAAQPEALELRGSLVERRGDLAVIVPADDLASEIVVPASLVRRVSGDVIVLATDEDPSPTGSTGRPDSVFATGDGAGTRRVTGSLTTPEFACRGLLRFRCNSDGTLTPVSTCLAIYDCRPEPR